MQLKRTIFPKTVMARKKDHQVGKKKKDTKVNREGKTRVDSNFASHQNIYTFRQSLTSVLTTFEKPTPSYNVPTV